MIALLLFIKYQCYTESWVKALSPTAGDTDAGRCLEEGRTYMSWVTSRAPWRYCGVGGPGLRMPSAASRELHGPSAMFTCSYLFTYSSLHFQTPKALTYLPTSSLECLPVCKLVHESLCVSLRRNSLCCVNTGQNFQDSYSVTVCKRFPCGYPCTSADEIGVGQPG